MIRYNVHLSEDLIEKIRVVSDSDGLTSASWIRMALTKAVKEALAQMPVDSAKAKSKKKS